MKKWLLSKFPVFDGVQRNRGPPICGAPWCHSEMFLAMQEKKASRATGRTHVGSHHPTALLGKGDIISTWSCHVISFSETSHTRKAARALGSEFRRFGFSLSLSEAVPDKFEVADPSGSLRGLSRGVALASKFSVFQPSSQYCSADWVGVPEIAVFCCAGWTGPSACHCRFYLDPCAALGSEKIVSNCDLGKLRYMQAFA